MKKRDYANKNEKAIDAVFGDHENFVELVSEAKVFLDDSMGRNCTFEQWVMQFCEVISESLSEYAACSVLGVDIRHHECRSKYPLELFEAQSIINGDIVISDGDVNAMLELIKAQEFIMAHKLFAKAYRAQRTNDQSLTTDSWKAYLVSVNEYFGGADEVSNIINQIEIYADKQALRLKLDNKFPNKCKVKSIKI